MLKSEIIHKIENSIAVCQKHRKRMEYAFSEIKPNLPFTLQSFALNNELQISHIDQFIFRFAKLQDELGNKLFRSILIFLDEDIVGLPFRDILGKLEKLKIIPSREEWLELKEIRNELAHEYPESEEQQLNALNLIFEKREMLYIVLESCSKTYYDNL